MVVIHHTRKKRFFLIISLLLALSTCLFTQEIKKAPLILQEMTWTDVEAYLENCNMVIIPLGSTEQHGPHLPLGSDYYEALEVSKLISARTGVLVAPVLMSGYSLYHSGFPGTLSLKPDTMAQVLFETAEILMKYGFSRFMFFNYHGGNTIVEDNVIHRINHSTKAVAVKIGIGAPFQDFGPDAAPFDHHAGISETSTMLFLKPELVKMARAEKPTMTFTPGTKELWLQSQEKRDLQDVFNARLAVPKETGKGGASREISSNGIWTFGDPKKATKERGKKMVTRLVDSAVKFIEAWQAVKNE